MIWGVGRFHDNVYMFPNSTGFGQSPPPYSTRNRQNQIHTKKYAVHDTCSEYEMRRERALRKGGLGFTVEKEKSGVVSVLKLMCTHSQVRNAASTAFPVS